MRSAAVAGVACVGLGVGVFTGVLPLPLLAVGAAETREAAPLATESVTDRVWLKVKAGDSEETMVIALYGKDCPKTVENFLALCDSTSPAFGFRGSRFHRIIPDFMLQGGDFTRGDGTGGTSLYGGAFKDENFIHKHKGAGVVSMANSGPNSNRSQFFITCRATPHLDGKHVVFGQVIDDQGDGLKAVFNIEKLGSRSGKPSKPVTIVACGAFPRSDDEKRRAAS